MKTAENILRLVVRAAQAAMIVAPLAQSLYLTLRRKFRRKEGAPK